MRFEKRRVVHGAELPDARVKRLQNPNERYSTTSGTNGTRSIGSWVYESLDLKRMDPGHSALTTVELEWPSETWVSFFFTWRPVMYAKSGFWCQLRTSLAKIQNCALSCRHSCSCSVVCLARTRVWQSRVLSNMTAFDLSFDPWYERTKYLYTCYNSFVQPSLLRLEE